MKSSLFFRFAGILIALTIAAGVAVSYDNSDGKGRSSAITQQTCINSISGLSEYQKGRITTMEARNQTAINVFQGKNVQQRRELKKIKSKKQMRKQAGIHRNAFVSVLSADQ